MNLEKYLKAIRYKISTSDTYYWKSYGPNARNLESILSIEQNITSNIVFDTENQTLYEVSLMCGEKSYRWIHPFYLKHYYAECQERNVNPDIAYDNNLYTTLLDLDNLLLLIKEAYDDGKVEIELELDQDLLDQLIVMAKDQNISLDNLINNILIEFLENKNEHKVVD